MRGMTSLTPPLRRSLQLHQHRTFSSNAALHSIQKPGVHVRRSAPPPRPRPALSKSTARIDVLIEALEASDVDDKQISIPEDSATPATSPPLPPPIQVRSPLVKYEKKTYAERHPKIPEQRPHTTFHSALIKNPYAQILASSIRADHDFQLRLPSALLARFSPKRHPETRENWILYDDNFRSRGAGVGGYTLGIKSAVERFGRKDGSVALRLIPVEKRSTFKAQGKWTWRGDMPEVIQRDMVREIYRRLAETGWKWGRDLEWRTGKMDSPAAEEEEGEKKVLGVLDWEDAGGPRALAVNGIVVPCFNMRDMLGEERVAEISTIWMEKGEHWLQGTRTLVYSTKQTTGLITELMRLRAYLELWVAYD